MDRRMSRSTDNFETETELIDIEGIDVTTLEALPDVVLSRALRRVIEAGHDQVDGYANFVNAPPYAW